MLILLLFTAIKSLIQIMLFNTAISSVSVHKPLLCVTRPISDVFTQGTLLNNCTFNTYSMGGFNEYEYIVVGSNVVFYFVRTDNIARGKTI